MVNKTIRYVVMDGCDGTGKTTQLKLVQERLQRLGKTVYLTRALGGDGSCDFQLSIRKALLHSKFPADTPIEIEESLFSMCDNAGVLQAIDFLRENSEGIVLKDRGVASHITYTMAKSVPADVVKGIHSRLFKTEQFIDDQYGALHLIFVPTDVQFTVDRINNRSKNDGTAVVERLENIEFQKKVAKLMTEIGSNTLASSFNMKIIMVKPTDTIEDIHQKVVEILRDEGVDI